MRLRIAGCLLICAAAAFGQGDRGTITGTVLDPQGAVIPNASIEARNTATDFKFTAGTSNTGNYTLTQIPAGTYELTVTGSGFKKYVRPGIIVPVAETVRVDATLQVGAPTDTVTVNAEAPLLKTESGEISHQIEYKAADELPLFTTNGSGIGLGNVRDPLSVLNLLPGASQSTDYNLRINGLPSNSQLIMIDGMDASNGLMRSLNQAVQQGTDAIQEVSVQTSNFAAEYGQAGGGYLNFTMKSGTNQYHGTAYEYFVNEAFNAGLPFTSQPCYTGPAGCTDHVKNDVRRSDYGFTLGGPVRIPKLYNGTNRTFFFFNFEQFRQSTTINNGLATMPLPAYTQGNFSGDGVFLGPFPSMVCPGPSTPTAVLDNVPCYASNTIFDSTTRRTLANGTIVETPFQNNTVPLSRQDPVALYLQSTFPTPNRPGALNNYTIPAYSQFKHTTIPSVKIDQALSSRMKLSGYFSETMTNANNTTGFAENIEPNTPSASRAYTYRINFDDTITPTLLFHVGIGMLYYIAPSLTQTSNYTSQAQAAAATVGANYAPFPASEYIPSFGGLSNAFAGGLALGSGFFAPSLGNGSLEVIQHEVKPTGNASLTWVRGNHTYKTGFSLVLDGYPQVSSERAFGEYTFSNTQTENPYEQTLANNFFPTGFNYASFLLGQVYNVESSPVNDTRLGSHALGLYLQDSWKITRRLTLEYGARWDYATLLSEEHGALSDANFQGLNPALTSPTNPNGLPGSIAYGATNHGPLDQTYPFSIGPHLGVAYQINPKTVLRAGGSISYATAPDNAELSYSVANFYLLGSPGFGMPSNLLKNGNPFSGPFALTFPEYNQFPFPTSLSGCGTAPALATACVPPTEPFVTIAKGAGRLPRVWQWSIGVQREVLPNLLVEAAYVGNRGTWFSAPLADTQSFNGTTPQRYANLLTEGPGGTPLFGATSNINLNNPTDFALLAQPISSPAVIARFPQLANPNNVYLGFPSSFPLSQALRPYPQWFGVPNFLGPPMGDTWYDSLQVKVTKRFSHGFSAQGAYTWSKSLTIDANSNTSYFTPGTIVLNDPYNTATQKELSALNIPQAMVISFSYTTPKIGNGFLGDNFGGKALRWLARDFTFSGVLRYQSGALMQSPASGNNLWNALGIGSGSQSGTFGNGVSNFSGGANALENVVPGQSCLAINPNSHFDPTKTLALNPNRWVDQDTIPGQTETFGSAAPYYANCRWQRQPAESLSAGRIFRIKEKYQLSISAQFFNVFNRVFYSTPSIVSSTTAPAFGNTFANGQAGALSSGFGFVNSVAGAGANPRSGQLVARFTF